MTQNSFMPLLGMAALAVVAYGLLSKKSPAVGMDSSGYSSSYGGGSSGSAPAGSAPAGVAEAVKDASAVAPVSTVVNTGGGSGLVDYSAWKKNADGTYTDTKGTVSTADDVKYAWQNNNVSVASAVSGVSQEAFDFRIAQDRSSNPLYKDVPINRGLPFLTKAPNDGVVGAVSLPDGVKVTSDKPSSVSASSSPFGVVWNSAMSVVDAITGTPTLAGMITGKGRGSMFI